MTQYVLVNNKTGQIKKAGKTFQAAQVKRDYYLARGMDVKILVKSTDTRFTK